MAYENAVKPVPQRREPGTKQSCLLCKWGVNDSTNPLTGACIFMRAPSGATWKRFIHDYHNTSCDNWEEGEVSFRDR
ncbi:MAG: benzylsuccinate synthase beta subunit family protein [Actinobacteria bacterium]|nr:benzylsuccinate synthase beta subunit family protein [Actinomycetota bacterium]